MPTLTAASQHEPIDAHGVAFKRTLRCMVYKDHKGLYVAECIDLDIQVKRQSANDAKRELLNAMVAHVRLAVETQEFSLLDRPSPASHRARFHMLKMANAIASRLVRADFFDWSPSQKQLCHC